MLQTSCGPIQELTMEKESVATVDGFFFFITPPLFL